jgi:hypothetical protein
MRIAGFLVYLGDSDKEVPACKESGWPLGTLLVSEFHDSFHRFVSFRIGAGYAFTFGEDWQIDNNKEIFNTPCLF